MESSGNFNLGNTDAWNGVNAYLQHKFASSTVTDGQNTALTISMMTLLQLHTMEILT